MKKFITTLLLVTLTSCALPPDTPGVGPIKFASKHPLILDVAEIHVIELYQPSLTPPNVEHTFPTPPVVGLKNWANSKLRGANNKGRLEMIINDASVVLQEHRKTPGLPGIFLDEHDKRYEGVIRVTFRLYDGIHPVSRAETSVFVKRGTGISESASVVEREEIADHLVRDMLKRFNQTAETQMRKYFREHLL